MKHENTLNKAIKEKIQEIRQHFKLQGELTPLVNQMVYRVAAADVDLRRHEVLNAQIPIADPRFDYLKTELHRAEKIHRLRLSALQRLLGRNGVKKKPDSFGISSYFGAYKVPGKPEELFTHWKFIQCNPDTYGFSPKLPKKGVIRINGEIFLNSEANKKLRDDWDKEQNEKYVEPNGGYYGGPCLSDEYAELIKAAKEKAGKYEILRPSQFSFSPPAELPVPEFNDSLPPVADPKAIKASRNRRDYLRRRAKQ